MADSRVETAKVQEELGASCGARKQKFQFGDGVGMGACQKKPT